MCETLWGDKVKKSTVSIIEGGDSDRAARSRPPSGPQRSRVQIPDVKLGLML